MKWPNVILSLPRNKDRTSIGTEVWLHVLCDSWGTWILCWWLLFPSVQFSSVTQSCPTISDPMGCSKPGFSVHYQLLELAQTHVHRVSGTTQPSHPLPSPSPPAFNLSQHQGLFQWVSSSYQVTKFWSFSFSISPSNEYSGLISFRMDWLDLLAVQGNLKSLLQHHSSKASVLQFSALYGPTLTYIHDHWKNHSTDETHLCW